MPRTMWARYRVGVLDWWPPKVTRFDIPNPHPSNEFTVRLAYLGEASKSNESVFLNNELQLRVLTDDLHLFPGLYSFLGQILPPLHIVDFTQVRALTTHQ